jgi:hypothetical protein
MDDPKDLSNRSALLRELAMDRRVPALDTSAHAQELPVVTRARDLQIRLPYAHVDDLFELHGARKQKKKRKKKKKKKKRKLRYTPITKKRIC